MLRATVFKIANNALNYFDDGLSVQDGDYYREGKIKAYFDGKTRHYLGLSGLVTRNKFSDLVHGINPITSGLLTTRRAHNARAGYDYTWNAVKSASIVYAITKDPAILKAHKKAVKLAKAQVEANMQTKTKYNGRTVYETTRNMLSSDFHHFTTRSMKDDNGLFVQDCHLNTHSFIYPCTWNPNKQRMQAVEEGNLRKMMVFYEATFHSFFSKFLAEAGYDIVRTRDRWEIRGISRELIKKFSRRGEFINKVAQEKGITDAKAKSQIGAKTREKKELGIKDSELYDHWVSRLTEDELKAIWRAKKEHGYGDATAITSKEAIDRSLENFFERLSAVPEKKILAYALSLGYGRLTLPDVQKELSSRENIVHTTRSTIKIISTKEMVQAEREMINFASSTKGTMSQVHPEYQIQNDILNTQQRVAILQLLSSTNQVSLLLGSAGVGKTSLLTEVQKAHVERGKKIFASAPSADASKVLKEKGFAHADTISAYLVNSEFQQKMKGSTWLIDEAGMIGVHTMNEIFKIARENQIRLILSGDPSQHQSVLAGDSLKWLVEKSEIRPAQVKTIVRQRKNEPYKQAVQELAQGNVLKGFDRLDKMGAVHEIEDQSVRHEKIATLYQKSIEEGRTALIVSPTHQEGLEITELLREKLKSSGLVKGLDREFQSHRALSYTQQEKQDSSFYEEGMIVQFHQNTKGFGAGKKYEVVGADHQDGVQVKSLENGELKTLDFDHHQNYNVFQSTKINLAEADLLRITRNGKTMQGSRINNGQIMKVKGFDAQGNIKMSNGKTLDKNYANISMGYVSTSQGSQGKDAQDLLVAQSSVSLPASSDRQFYVSISRGTETVNLFTDNRENLRDAIKRSSDRLSAQEVNQEHHQRERMVRADYHRQLQTKEFDYERAVSREQREKLPEPRQDIG